MRVTSIWLHDSLGQDRYDSAAHIIVRKAGRQEFEGRDLPPDSEFHAAPIHRRALVAQGGCRNCGRIFSPMELADCRSRCASAEGVDDGRRRSSGRRVALQERGGLGATGLPVWRCPVDVAKTASVDVPPTRFPAATGTFQCELSSLQLDRAPMPGESSRYLFENIPHPLTDVFRCDNGPAEDESDFHTIAHGGSQTNDRSNTSEQSVDQGNRSLSDEPTPADHVFGFREAELI